MRYYLQWGIAYLFALASAAMASLFGFMSSVGPYAYAKAVVLCLVAFAGCHGPAWASRLRQAYGVGAAFLGGLAAFACLIVTLWGGLGTMASGGEELRAERTKAAADAADDRATLARLLTQRQQLPAARPSATVLPLISTARDGTTYKAKLEAELATAHAGERLDGDIATVNMRLRSAPPPLAADPEASAFAQLTGISVATSAALKALLVSLALEAAAMVAMLVAWAERKQPRGVVVSSPEVEDAPVRASRRPQPPPPRAPVLYKTSNVVPIPKVYGSVKKFAAACIAKSDGDRLEVKALLVRYQHWCKEGALPAANLDRFLDDIEQLYEIAVDGTKAYAVNVRLAA